jgi:hypothetical protein
MRAWIAATGARLVLLLLLLPSAGGSDSSGSTPTNTATTNLYELLGIDADVATKKEIKAAYRRKALETHPDKQTSVNAEEAAAAFRAVVHAFEVLSDPDRRERYDTTGRTDEEDDEEEYYDPWAFHWHQQQQQQQQQQYQAEEEEVHLHDSWEGQMAQARMLHLMSLAQLQMVMLDEDEVALDRHFVICFATPGAVEEWALSEMVFPYPFAGTSTHGVWWEYVLQTMYVRVTPQSANLARFFGITEDDFLQSGGAPIFVCGKEGASLENGAALSFARLQTVDRDTMVDWIWEQIKVEVTFVNEVSSVM